MKRPPFILLILLAIVGLVVFNACERFSSGTAKKFSGTLELTEHSLGARVAGRLATLDVQEGDEVKAGQRIATLDRFEQAQKDYDRAKQLFDKGGTTQQSLEYSALARDDQQVVSPLDGVALVKVQEIGEVVSAGTAVVVIGDRADMWVRIYVPEGVVNMVKMGQEATIHFDGLKESVKGRISYIAPRAEFTPRNVQTEEERVTQTFAVKVRLDNPPAYLRPGVAADVYLLR